MTFKTSYEYLPNSVANWHSGSKVDFGTGWSMVEVRTPIAPPAHVPNTGSAVPVYGGGVAVAGFTAAPAAAAPQEGWSILLGLAMYPWMLMIGGLAYVFVSAPVSFTSHAVGLHLHPLYGVGAAFITIWLYRRLTTFLPTAVALALPSAVLSGAIAWAASDSIGFERFVESINWNLSAPANLWMAVSNHLPMTNGWVIAAVLLNLAAHAAYWWHRRTVTHRS